MTLADPAHLPGPGDPRNPGPERRVPEHQERQPGDAAGECDADADIQTQVKHPAEPRAARSGRDKLHAEAAPRQSPAARSAGRVAEGTEDQPADRRQLWPQALGTAAGGVRVRSSGTNRIVDVSCDSTNGQLAADFCNTLTHEYIDQNLEARWKTTEYTGEWLTKQLQDLKIKLEKQRGGAPGVTPVRPDWCSQCRVSRRRERATSAGRPKSRLLLQKELSSAQADRIAKQSKFEMASSEPGRRAAGRARRRGAEETRRQRWPICRRSSPS